HWVLIADGHHRYESCLVYRNEMMQQNPDQEAPFHFTLMFFTNIDHPGIAVLPYNRAIFGLPHFDPNSVLKKAEKYFVVHEFDEEGQAQNALKKAASTTAFLALIRDRRGYLLFKLKPNVKLHDFYPEGTPSVVQHLDVNILHRIFIHGILSITQEDVQKQ